ncbi:Clp protease ClpP [Fulvivirga sp. 29W222]|uniref:ATP-dependent Clp protease proteolytic subunit n=1 Tax=Fulvivirga marina TaxID=2494733 RepID=A0A937FW37_9BACT|nr:Clp protease ClpP [Fulvivirga marina]MBL6445662.1 Clp protease ClpP [Fulvivirga marina]
MRQRVLELNLTGTIDRACSEGFVQQFKKLEAQKPDKIYIRINSPGGSVLHGWSMVDVVMNSKIPTTAIVVGVAASMATTVMAAADKAVIMEHASLMIHNPFDPTEVTEHSSPQVKIYAGQIATLYAKRWGKHKSQIMKIMAGATGGDGTWYNAQQALDMGIVSNIITLPHQTSSQRTLPGMAATLSDIESRSSNLLTQIRI